MGKRVVDDTSLAGVAEAIRAKTGKADALVFPEDFSAGVADVFAAGVQSEYDRFWDMFQQNGNRIAYFAAFMDWGWEYIESKYKIIPKDDGIINLFAYDVNLKKVDSAHIDLSQWRKNSDTEVTFGYQHLFLGCSVLEEIEDIGMKPAFYYRTFLNCRKLHTIAVVRFNTTTLMHRAFDNCNELVNLTAEGTIGQNGLNLQWSTKLSKTSITSIINTLSSTTSGLSITLSNTAVNNAFTTEEWATLAATKSNWTINLV